MSGLATTAREKEEIRNTEISLFSMGRPDVGASRATGDSSSFVFMGIELCPGSSPLRGTRGTRKLLCKGLKGLAIRRSKKMGSQYRVSSLVTGLGARQPWTGIMQ